MLGTFRHYLLDLGRDLSAAGVENSRRHRVVAGCCWLMLALNSAYGVQNIGDGMYLLVVFNAVSGGAGLFTLIGMQRGLSARVGAWIATGAVFATVTASTVMAGGPETPDVMWLLLVPQAGALLGGVPLAGAASLASLTAFLVLHGLAQFGVWPDNAEVTDWFTESAGLLGATIAVNLVFLHNQRGADRRSSDALDELRREVVVRRAAEDRATAGDRAKSAFLATLSHEIRTPLNGVLGMAELLAARDLSEEDASSVRTISSSGKTLLTLLNDVLELSRLEAGQMPLVRSNFDLHEVLEQTAALFRGRAAAGVTLVVAGLDGCPQWVHGDEGRVRQVLGNLVGNAVKFTQQGRVEVGAVSVGPGVRLSVADTGVGICDDAVSHIFDAFQQANDGTHGQFGGTGLGLAIVSRLVEAMEGEVTVDSVVGRGSRFEVYLPLSRAAVQPPRVQNRSPHTHLPQHVLVVDDNAVNRAVAVGMLGRLGHTAAEADGGQSALRALIDDEYDLVLLDISMPDLDGHQVLRAIRNDPRHRYLRVIALTAHAMAGDERLFLAEGFDAYLAKPLLMKALHSVVEASILRSAA